MKKQYAQAPTGQESSQNEVDSRTPVFRLGQVGRNAETFQRLALVETHRRGVETAQHVIAPTDGAVWIQGFLDYHRPDAQRILDFGHAAGYVATIGGVVGLPESAAFQSWLKTSLHTLKHDGATAVLPELQAQVTAHPEQAELAEALTYLEKRTAMMNYPEYQRQGWPIGSGSVESGNKVVVEARLKGAGMHWAPSHVNPMLSLRNAICSERWHEAWQAIVADHRRQRCQRFLNRARRNTVAPLPPPLPALPKLQNQSIPSDVSAAEPKEAFGDPLLIIRGSLIPVVLHPTALGLQKCDAHPTCMYPWTSIERVCYTARITMKKQFPQAPTGQESLLKMR